MRRSSRRRASRPLPPLQDHLPYGVDPYTCQTDEDADQWRTRTQEDLYSDVLADAEWSVLFSRPQTTAECPPGNYCPFVSCKFHLYLDVNPETGTLILNHPDRNVWDLEECCVLKALEKRAAGRGEDGFTLEEVGRFMGLTRERVRQIEQEVRRKVRADASHGRAAGYRDMYTVDDD